MELLEQRHLLAAVTWDGGGDASRWSDPLNWSSNALPGAADDVTIGLGAGAVTYDSGSHAIQSLTIGDHFTLAGGTLIVTGNLLQQNTATFTMAAGTLRSATVVGEGNAVFVASGGTLDGVTLGGTVGGVPTSATIQSSNHFSLTGGLTFANGSVLGLGNQLFATGNQTLGGDGEIRFREAYSAIFTSGHTTFGPGLTIHRSDANFSDITVSNGGSITNHATIRADAGGQIRVFSSIGSASFTNASSGVLAADGGTLNLVTDWSNAGQLAVNSSAIHPDSTLNLGGRFTTAGVGSLTRTGGTINLTGLLENTGSVLALNAATGSWNLGVNGRLRRGSLVTSDGSMLTVNGGILDGLTLGATVGAIPMPATVQGALGGAGAFIVTGGLTFSNGSIVELGTGMILDGDQTLGGEGEIRFRGNGGITNTFQTTFGPGLTIHRSEPGHSDINLVAGSITSHGTIRADAGGEIRLTGNPGTSFTNAIGGVWSADGGTLSLLSSWSNAGEIEIHDSTINLGGSFTTMGLGGYTRTGGTINLVGLLDNEGQTLVLDAAAGSWNLASGVAEVRGGNLVTLDGAAFVVTNANGSGNFNGVTLGGMLGGVPASATILGNDGAGFAVKGGLTFANGSLLDLANGMVLLGDQTLSGNGVIRGRSGTGINIFGHTTFGPGLTIQLEASNASINTVSGSITNRATIRVDEGQTSVIGNAGTSFTNAVGGVLSATGGTFIINNVINHGMLNVTGGALNLRGVWSSSGALQVTGGTANLGGTWFNSGVFQVTGGTLNLGGAFTTAELGTFTTDRSGAVNLTGTLDNTGHTFALNDTTGSLILQGGAILGGRVSTNGSAELVTGTIGTLNAVTLAGTVRGLGLAVTGGLTLEQGIVDVGQVSINGTQTLGGTGTLLFSTSNPFNDLRVLGNATLTIGPGITIRGVTGFIGSNSFGRILNQGTIAADGGGTLTVGGISNFAAGTLTGGTWQVSGNSTLQLIGADVIASAADILIDGANARLYSDGGSKHALAALAVNAPAARLRVDHGANLTTSATNFINQGDLTVGTGSTLVASTLTIEEAGSLTGSGTIVANLVNHGEVRPGAPLGNLNINGSYLQGATGRLEVELGGATAPSQYDRLSISGSATLSGTLAVSLIDGFGPTTGQEFDVVTFANHTGKFNTVTGLSQGHFPLFTLAVEPASVALKALANGTDLAFDSFQSGTIPASAMPGQNVSLTYSVNNLSDPSATGNWIDSVYLSRDGLLDPSDALLTRVEHVGGVAGLGGYSENVTATLPALIDGNYRVIVVADSRGLISDADRANNTGVSSQAINVTVPLLTLGSPLSASIAPGQDLYYRVLVAPGTDVTLAADFANSPRAEVSVRYGALPDSTNQGDVAPTGDLRPRLVLSNAQGGTYYIRLHGRDDAPGNIAFTLAAAVSGFEITSFSPQRGSNRGTVVPAIVTLHGAHFTRETLVSLHQTGGASRAAQSVEFISENKLVAKFDLIDLPVGDYEIMAEDAGQTTVALDDFTVTNNDGGGTGAWISTIAICRVGCTIKLKLGYYNTSDNPLPAPLVQVRATDVFPGPDETTGALTMIDLPGFLPGASSDLASEWKWEFDPFKTYGTHPTRPGTSNFELSIIEPSQTPMNWDSQKAALRPATYSPEVWDAVWSNLRPQLGETLSDFYLFLSITKLKLREAGEELVNSIDRLFGFELQRANNMQSVPVPATAVDVAFPAPGGLPLVFVRSLRETISGRYRQGRLGRGWTDNFDISVNEDAATGIVTLQQGEAVRFFGRLPDGSYESAPGDLGVLSKVSGALQVREQNGELIGFRADNGLLDFLQDTNGNRLFAGYTGAQLTSLTHTNGAALTLAYNAQGRIRQITDPAGDTATYEYDASGEHLIRVVTTAGTTEYAYSPDATGPRAHALTSITFLDGTHLFFDYDSKGRLVRQQGDGGTAELGVNYDTASFTVTDADDQVTTFFHDDSFRIRRVRDPLGRLSYVEYDASGNPVIVGATGGGEASLAYDRLGNPTLASNPLGETLAFTYDSEGSQLIGWEDSLGHGVQFDLDADGNRLSTMHADGSREQYSYDALGNVNSSVNRLGQSVQFTYGSLGLVTRKSFADGTHVDYTYNLRANLETVVDASGTTRLEYLDAQNPDLVTKVSYPTGRFLEYTYENGRRTRMVDQSGFAINYIYDAAGRLDILRDGGQQLIVDYDYDLLGQLTREARANATVTSYAYDHAGQLLEITHRAADATIQSQFVYEYDQLGRRTSVTTLEGTTKYRYDGAGRLTSAELPNGRDLIYAYDAAGNRTVSSDNGASTNYTANELNQYVAFGATSQVFDAAGNLTSLSSPVGNRSFDYDVEGKLIRQTTPAGTWTYEYDSLGNRIASSHNGVRTEYLIDPFGLGNVVGEYDAAGNLQANYIHGLGLTSRVESAGPAAYYQFDALGNTTELTGVGGAVLNAYSYLPFGESLTTSETVANAFEHVGRFGVMREGSGVDFMRNRWYAPDQGRFTQADPIGLAGGPNFYAYVANNPISQIDPSGLGPADEIITGVMSAEVEMGLLAKDAARALAIQARDAVQLANSTQVATVIRAETAAWGDWLSSNRPEITRGGAGATALRAGYYSLAAVQRAAMLARAASVLQSVGRVGAYGFIAAGVAVIGFEAFYFGESVAEIFGADTPECVSFVPDVLQPGCRVPLIPGGTPVQTLSVTRVNLSRDPNDIVGPAGFGAEGFIVPQATLPYLIRFQNLPAAEGPAAEVIVTQVLDADLDLETFALEEFGFGDITVPVPAGRHVYSTRLDLPSTRGVFVDVAASLDRASRTVTWRFQAIDPETLDLPVSPFVGFLPPDKVAPEGQGFVSFSVRAKPGLPESVRIDAQATIVFDTNDPIDTNLWVNTFDDAAPVSSVDPLPATTATPSFVVRWSGSDNGGFGSGVAHYDVFVSEDGAPFTVWQEATTQMSASFTGATGHTYRFYSVATDNIGHVELTPTAPDAATSVVVLPHVTGILVRGSEWSDAFLAELATRGMGSGGFAIPTGSCGQLVPLRWTNVDQIIIEFDQQVRIQAGDLSVTGLNVPAYTLAPGGFAYDQTTRRATWTFSQRFGADKLFLALSDEITDNTANPLPLDGDWTNVLDTFPSGNGTAGNSFHFNLNVLPGDYDGNERTEDLDFRAVLDRQFKNIALVDYDVLADLDGDGFINVVDLALSRDNLDHLLPFGDPRGNLINAGSVVGVVLSGSTWPESTRRLIDPSNGIGYLMPVGSCHQFDPLPWASIDQVSIAFSENMAVAAEDLALRGVAVQQYTLADGGFSYDAARRIATWTFAEQLSADKLLIVLSDRVRTQSGNLLDGDWTDLARTFSSGDGTPGGDFAFRFNVLPGDVNQDASIDAPDVRAAASRFWNRPGDDRYSPLADFMAHGMPTLAELIELRNQQTVVLPNGEPTMPVSIPSESSSEAATRAAAVDQAILRLVATRRPVQHRPNARRSMHDSELASKVRLLARRVCVIRPHVGQ